MNKSWRMALAAGVALAATGAVRAADRPLDGAQSRPNIVYVLADDLGYGDVHCNNAQGKIATPNMDRLAAGGMRFTDAHSGSAVCTPTRYGILTGRYAWRTRLQAGVLQGFSPRLIAPAQLTVAAMLKQQGYQTAAIGKWHLGLDWPEAGGKVDYAKPVHGGPVDVGFDYFFGVSASLDMPPYTFIENDRVTAVPTDHAAKGEFGRQGPRAPDFHAVDVLPALTGKAVSYLERRAGTGQPFFLYLPLTAPHTPIAPSKEFQGKSGLNAYGDFVMEVDWALGQVLDALERQNLVGNTLVIFTSDNGCSPAADVKTLEAKGHYPSYHFRGYKADIWDGGHRIPFIARWPGKVQPGAVCDDTIGLMDLMATSAQIVQVKLPDTAAEDSVSILPDLLGTATGPVREALVHHSINGSFALRQGAWKLELCRGSGGWSAPRPGSAQEKTLPSVQLYDMQNDVGEQHNVQAAHPDVVRQLTKVLERYIADGRSIPGTKQANDVTVNIWKHEPPVRDGDGNIITHD